MKIFILIITVLLSSCTYKDKENKNINVNTEPVKVEENQKNEPVEEEMGYAFTVVYDNSPNRVTNIKLACDYISGKVVLPNEEFSFNDTVGKRNAQKGFREAPVLVSGESKMGIGGGVCQVSSTIHLAALNAGLNITERHSHSKQVVYAAKGLDAAVEYGEMDFKFINNTTEPIYIYVWFDSDKIYSKIVTYRYK